MSYALFAFLPASIAFSPFSTTFAVLAVFSEIFSALPTSLAVPDVTTLTPARVLLGKISLMIQYYLSLYKIPKELYRYIN